MEKEELSKLSPEERLLHLKKLKEEKEKEIADAQRLITASEAELAAQEQAKKELPIDQLKAEHENMLSGTEEKELFETKRFVNLKKKEDDAEEKEEETTPEHDLEEEVADAPSFRIETPAYRTEQPAITGGYESTLRSIADLYAEIRNLYETTRINEEVRTRPATPYERGDDQRRPAHQFTDEQRRQLYELEEEARAKQDAINEGNYTASENIKEQLDLATRIMKYMR